MIYDQTLVFDFEAFLKSKLQNAWVLEPGISIYLRKTGSNPYTNCDFDLANMNAKVLGSGSLTKFLDKFEPRFTFRIENILNDRLVPYFQQRGYVITNPDDYDSIFNMEKP